MTAKPTTPEQKEQQLRQEMREAIILHALVQAGGEIHLALPDLAQLGGVLSAISRGKDGTVHARLLNRQQQPIHTPNEETRRIQRGALAALLARGGLWTVIADDEMTVNLDRDIFWKRQDTGAASLWRVGEPRLALASRSGLIMPNDGRVQ